MWFGLQETRRLVQLCLIIFLECLVSCQSRVGWSPLSSPRNNDGFCFRRQLFCTRGGGGGPCPPPPPPPRSRTIASTVSSKATKRNMPLPPPEAPAIQRTLASSPHTNIMRPPPPRPPPPPLALNKQQQIKSFVKREENTQEFVSREATEKVNDWSRAWTNRMAPASRPDPTPDAGEHGQKSEEDVLAMYESLLALTPTTGNNLANTPQIPDFRATEKEENKPLVDARRQRVWDLSDLFSNTEQNGSRLGGRMTQETVNHEQKAQSNSTLLEPTCHEQLVDDIHDREKRVWDLSDLFSSTAPKRSEMRNIPEQVNYEPKPQSDSTSGLSIPLVSTNREQLVDEIETETEHRVLPEPLLSSASPATRPRLETQRPTPDLELHPSIMDKSALSTFQTLLNYRRDAQAMEERVAPDMLSDNEENVSLSSTEETVVPQMLRKALDNYTDKPTERLIAHDILSDNEENTTPTATEEPPVSLQTAMLQEALDKYTEEQPPKQRIIMVRKKVHAAHKVPRRTILSSMTDFASDLTDQDFTSLLTDLALPSTVDETYSTYEYDEETVLYEDEEETEEAEEEGSDAVNAEALSIGANANALLQHKTDEVESYSSDYESIQYDGLNPFLAEEEQGMVLVQGEATDTEEQESESEYEYDQESDVGEELFLDDDGTDLEMENLHESIDERYSILDTNALDEYYSKVDLLNDVDTTISPYVCASSRNREGSPVMNDTATKSSQDPYAVELEDVLAHRRNENNLLDHEQVAMPNGDVEHSRGRKGFAMSSLGDVATRSTPSALNHPIGKALAGATPTAPLTTAYNRSNDLVPTIGTSESVDLVDPVSWHESTGPVDPARSPKVDVESHSSAPPTPPLTTAYNRANDLVPTIGTSQSVDLVDPVTFHESTGSVDPARSPKIDLESHSSARMENQRRPPTVTHIPERPSPPETCTLDRSSAPPKAGRPPPPRPPPPVAKDDSVAEQPTVPYTKMPAYQQPLSGCKSPQYMFGDPVATPRATLPPPPPQIPLTQQQETVEMSPSESDSEEVLDETELKLLDEADVTLHEHVDDLDAYKDDLEEDSMDEDDWRILQLSQWTPTIDDDSDAAAEDNDLYFFAEEENDTDLEVSSEDLTDADEYAIAVGTSIIADESGESTSEEEDVMFLGDSAVERLPREFDQPPAPPPYPQDNASEVGQQQTSQGTMLAFGLPPPPANARYGQEQEWVPPSPPRHQQYAHQFGQSPRMNNDPLLRNQQSEWRDETRMPPPPGGQ